MIIILVITSSGIPGFCRGRRGFGVQITVSQLHISQHIHTSYDLGEFTARRMFKWVEITETTPAVTSGDLFFFFFFFWLKLF